MVLLPLIILVAFQLGQRRRRRRRQRAASSPAWPTSPPPAAPTSPSSPCWSPSGFLLVVVVALFCGDTVASEASWGSLRYLLAIPVPRARLLGVKLIVGAALLPAGAAAAGRDRPARRHPALRLGAAQRRRSAARSRPAERRAAAGDRRLPVRHAAGRRLAGVPALGVDRRPARRGRRRGPAADPVQHPRPDRRRSARSATSCRPTTATPGSGCCPRRCRPTTWSRAASPPLRTRRSSLPWRGGGSCEKTW